MSPRAPKPPPDDTGDMEPSRIRLLEAAEQILITDGQVGVTTRKVAAVAGLNHGLVHYYFGTLDELFIQVFEGFTARLLDRQRLLYGADGPFLDKWREAMRYLEMDVADGYQKVWAELYSRALNRPELLPRLAAGYEAWRVILRAAFAQPYRDFGLADSGLSLEDWVTLVITFNAGMGMEMIAGVRTGHRQLLRSLDEWLAARSPR